MVVVSIGAILATIAVPSLRDTLNDFRQKSAHSLLVSDLTQARGEAIKRNVRLLVCVRNAAGDACVSGTDWQAGWLVCLDADADGACDTATAALPNPIIVRLCLDADADGACDTATAALPNPIIVRPALDAVLTLTGPATPLRFNANSSQGATGSTAVTFTLAGTWSGAVSRVITVAPTGNISKS
ncbi:MAG: hypothetical protein A2496_20630 [Burkholderiales bacterium RIFOXYC12_FULL_60_6]|nr:MAG: hypothetical protein A2496_20630 [Burkholderiales bacterium RIFOXYC12_FULL_60_6]